MFTWVAVVGLACMWLVAIVRAPAAVGHPQQRALWLAVTLIAFTTTLHMEPVTQALGGLVGDVTAVVLFKHLCDVVASTAMLHFVLHSVGYRGYQSSLFSFAAAVSVTLVWINLAMAPGDGVATPELELPTHYWVILFGFHLAADIAVVATCWRYCGRAEQWALRWALFIFGLGTAFACVLWAMFLTYVVVRAEPILEWTLLVTGVEEILQATGAAIPMVPGIQRTLASRRALWRLWPLWRDLTSATPEVTLITSRYRLRDVLRRVRAVDLRLYRVVIEIRDSILILGGRVSRELLDRARAHVAEHGAPGSNLDAAVVACVISAARRRKAARPDGGALTLVELGGDDLRGEIAYLTRIAAATSSSVTSSFLDRLAVEGDAPVGQRTQGG
ncbi:MAG: hypothetical protein M3548_21860 [Actinomycetota bacterium]|nr:hypothetical protein [Actinomycetota bacterium]